MPYMCCILKCSNSVLNSRRKNYSFHRFPKDEVLLIKWLKNINRANFVPTKHTRICSAHFEEWCFNERDENHMKTNGIPSHRRSLRPEAVPTIFNALNIVRTAAVKTCKSNRKSKKKGETLTGSTNDSTQTGKSSDGTMPAVCNQSYNHHSTDANSYDAMAEHNGHAEFDSSHLTKAERTSPEPDTYELTELTPMAKQERLSPLPHAYNDNAEYRIITDLDNPFHVPIKESFGMSSPMGLLGALPNNSEPSVYSEALKKCIISESFLYTLLRLIKCPQCGFGTNSEQMQKYENQGCILGVRLLCYNGHLVLDWRL